MKNIKKIFYLLICAISMFAGFGNASAAESATFVSKESVGGSGHYKMSNGLSLYCADGGWADPSGTYYKMNLTTFFKNYELGNLDAGSLTIVDRISLGDEARAKALIHKLAGIKYYYEKELKAGGTSTQHAMWRTIGLEYGRMSSHVGIAAGKTYDDAVAWYNNNKESIEIEDSSAWTRSAGNSNAGGQPLFYIKERFNPPGDYSLDMACENCNSTNSDNKAIVIQDTTDWDAILRSKKAASYCKKDALTGYYAKADNVYCREEYHVYYPNANKRISVQVGRFFVVNASQSELDVIDSSIPNFAPIKVQKIRQCKKVGNGDLAAFKNSSDAGFKNCGGTITIGYSEYNEATKEGYKDGYKYSDTAKSSLVAFNSEIEGDTLTQRAEFSYTLKDNVYRYIRIADGYSIKKLDKNIDPKNGYRDLKVSNLPISFNAKTRPNVSLSYTLPDDKCDSYSSIKKAYDDSGNDYLTCTNKPNVYNGSSYKGTEKLSDSACAKLYGGTTSDKFKTCVSDRTKNRMGKCLTENDYICNLPVSKTVECDKKTAGKSNIPGQSDYDKNKPVYDFSKYTWDNVKQVCTLQCVKQNGKYYGPDGNPTTAEDYEKKCCRADNHEEFGRDWNPNNGGYCCEAGTTYSEVENRCCDSRYFNPETGRCSGKPSIIPDSGDCNAGNWRQYKDIAAFVDGKCCKVEDYVSSTNTCVTCTSSNYKGLGRDWDEKNNKCCPEKYSYDGEIDECVPNNKCATLGCGEGSDRPCCDDGYGHSFCGYYVNGNAVCSGKPNILTSVYRTINPDAPFISQNGETRTEVGENWCSYGLAGQKAYTCSPNDNPVVENVIKKANTSEENALYTINLDTKAINELRAYNRDHSYDDFSLVCDEKTGSKCKSTIISQYADSTKSKCLNVDADSIEYYKCADSANN